MTSTNARAVPQDEYTVGWVCALPCEMAAAKAMLDEIHHNIVEQDPADHNSYILGQIQNHNVVIACLPAGTYGTTPAATVAKDLLRTFKSIRFGLMVGIGGGVPSSTHDIRLGDIVVSQPTGTSGGVVQYDRGKTVQEGEFQRTGSLNAPPQVLLAALSHLQADRLTGESQIPHFLSQLIIKHPKMKKRFSYQGGSNDCIFRAEYDHADPDSNCDQCDKMQTIQRDTRDETDPEVHYGIIASGNQVIKHGSTRDQLSKQLGVLCFEMEAAGLMQDFPCIVVRGVCDYADSHKNKRWQEYAAATAAAFAKELLSVLSPVRVLQEKPIPQLVSDPQLHELVIGTNAAIAEQTWKHEARYESQTQVDCHRAFKTSKYEEFKNMNPDRILGTCRWVLGHPQYVRWQGSSHDDLLWISADPGCGKSVLSKSLVDRELRSTEVHTVCYFFFKDNEEQDSIATALCALLHQLFHHQPLLLRHAMDAYKKNGEQLQKEVDELWRIFIVAATDEHAKGVTCVLDALDECRGDGRRKLIQLLTSFYARRTTKHLRDLRETQLKFLVTSRPYRDIENGFSDIPDELPSIRLAGEESNADISQEINLVIEAQVSRAGRELNLDQDVQNMLQTKLLQTPHRTYLWLHLVVEELYSSGRRTKKAYTKIIESLPDSVENAYEKLLSRNGQSWRHEAEILLHIVVGSRRPLTLTEMDVAFQLATDSAQAQTHGDLDLDNDHLESRIRDLCGLFIFVNDFRVYLIHQTAKEFLVSKGCVENLTSGSGNPWKWSLEEHQTDTLLAQICVQYLSLQDIDDKRFGQNVEEEDGTSEDSNLDEYPFLEYAAVHWPTHFRSAKVYNMELFNRVLQLYEARQPRFETWVSIFWETTRQYKKRTGMTGIHYAALNGHGDVLSHLLDATQIDLGVKDGVGRTGLYWASGAGHEETVQVLIEKGADVNATGGIFGNALQAAAYEGHERIVQTLTEKGADINATDGKYGNALQAAAHRGHERIVQTLIKKGADVNTTGGEYGNALQAAAHRGHEKVAQMLIEKGADINATGGHYGNALHTASAEGHKKVAQVLIEKGADVNATGGRFGNALQTASAEGHERIVQTLIEKGADVNATGGIFGNALQTASAEGHKRIVLTLIEKGADVNATGGIFGNALQAAAYEGHERIVQTLIEKGADINATGGIFGNALQAAVYKDYKKVTHMLIKKGADVNATGGYFGNALQTAAYKGYKKVTQMLIEKGADVNATGGIFGNALQTASAEGHERTVQILIKKGVDVNATGGYYGNALQAAAHRGHDRIIQTLIKKGADVSATGGYYGNALQAASSGGYEKVIQMLIEKGADVNATTDGKYGNALRAAAYRGHEKVIQMLIEKGADVNATTDGKYGNALRAAAYRGHEKVTQMLIEKGADVNATTDGKYGNALQAAAFRGHEKVAQMLIEKGADVSATGGYYGNALQAASCSGSKKIVMMLLETGNVDSGYKNPQDGRTALSYAAESGHESVVKLLLADDSVAGSSRDNIGRTPLFFASNEGHVAVFNILLAQSPLSSDWQDHYGSTPLSVAARKGHAEVLKSLLGTESVELNSRDRFGRTPLWWAKRCGHAGISQLLIESGKQQGIQLEDDQLAFEVNTRSHDRAAPWCDICLLSIPESTTYYYCPVCNCGDYDICLDCFNFGGRCLATSHELVQAED